MDKLDFHQLYSMYSKRLYYTALAIVHDPFLAEDIVQESFLKAFKKMDSIDDCLKIASWLNSIAVRTAIDFLRVEKRKKWLPSDHSLIESVLYSENHQDLTEKEVEHRLFKQDLHESINDLSKEYKEVLLLRIHHGLKEKEIASCLKIKTTTVKNRLYRARKQLIQVLTEKYPA